MEPIRVVLPCTAQPSRCWLCICIIGLVGLGTTMPQGQAMNAVAGQLHQPTVQPSKRHETRWPSDYWGMRRPVVDRC